MRYYELFETPLHFGSQAFKAWFSGSKVVDAQGNPLPVYHGTRRPDRVGNRFQKKRATSGPMAFFTDDSEIASNYAQNKPNTSLEVESYNEWFKVKIRGRMVNLDQAWYYLPYEEKQRISRLAPRVTREEFREPAIFLDDPERKDGIGNYQQAIRDNRSNPLAALIDGWLAGGTLHGDEQDFLKVLKAAGMTTPVIFEHPDTTYPYVYKVYLSIKNPLIADNIPQNVLDALAKAARRQKVPGYVTNQWDKKYMDPKVWFRGLLDDIEKETSYTWTCIPDWVTKILQGFDYDGIKDTGGKNGGSSHAVWIPFDEHQVKSAIGNKGSYDPNKNHIDS